MSEGKKRGWLKYMLIISIALNLYGYRDFLLSEVWPIAYNLWVERVNIEYIAPSKYTEVGK